MTAALRGRLGVALALATVYVVWGSTYLAIRVAIATLPPFLMAGVRFVLAGAILYAYARLTGVPRPTGRQWAAAALTGALLLLCGNGGVVWAQQYIASGLAALLVAMLPLHVALLEWFLPGGQRPAGRVLLGLALGLTGVAGLVRPSGDADATQLWAALALTGASLSWAVGSLYWRSAGKAVSPLLGTGMQMLAGGALLALAGVATGEPARFVPADVTLKSLLAVAYLLVFGSLIAFTAFVWLLRNASPTLVSTYAFVNPVVAVALGCGLAGEPFTVPMVLAGGAVLLSVVLIVTAPKAGGQPRTEPEDPAATTELRMAPAEVSS
jgi:drug/metabolite transporter (DMT)-like permease